jgi:hypothetical protein
MSVVSQNLRYETKWTRARKIYLSWMRNADQNYELALNGMLKTRDQNYQAARKGDYKSEIIMKRLDNAITYAINLAFGTDLAKK